MPLHPDRPARSLAALAVLAVAGSALVAPSSVAAASAAGADGADRTSERRIVVRNYPQLKRAVKVANQANGADRVHLGADITFPTKGKALVVTDALVLNGRGFTIDARQADRILDVVADVKLRVKNADLTGGKAAEGESGGAIRVTGGILVVKKSTLRGNRAVGELASGGAIMNDGGDVRVINSKLLNNRAERAGGGIEALAGVTSVDGTLLKANRTGAGPGNGGAVHLTGAGAVTVAGSKVIKNVAAAEGGGLWNSAVGMMDVRDTVLRGNVVLGAAADQGGGALFNDGGTMTASGLRILRNAATGTAGSGGGVFNNGGTLSMQDSLLANNTSKRAGGAIETLAGEVDLAGIEMRANSTGAMPGNGGGLHITGMATVNYDGGSVTGNSAATEGGGLWNSSNGFLNVTDVVISDNTAPDGPDTFNDGGVFIIDGMPVF
jgi:hypothetical protein